MYYRNSMFFKARSSVGERYLDTVEVGSSILPVPTIIFIMTLLTSDQSLYRDSWEEADKKSGRVRSVNSIVLTKRLELEK